MACDKNLFSVVVCADSTLREMAAKSNKLMKPLSIYVFVTHFAICSPSFIKEFTCLNDPVESLAAIPRAQNQGRW